MFRSKVSTDPDYLPPVNDTRLLIQTDTYNYISLSYTVFCVSATFVSVVEAVRQVFIYHRYLHQLRAEIDGISLQSSIGAVVLFELVPLLTVLLDDLLITGLIFVAQVLVGCYSAIWVTNSSIRVVMAGSCANSFWKFWCCNFNTAAWRR